MKAAVDLQESRPEFGFDAADIRLASAVYWRLVATSLCLCCGVKLVAFWGYL